MSNWLDELPFGNEYSPPERIVCAANKYGELVIAGVRHGCPVMSDSLDTSLTYNTIGKKLQKWDDEATNDPRYLEGHSCSYAVAELSEIIEQKGYDIPKFERSKEIQGFLTSRHRFVDRFEAWKIAVEQKQIVRRVGGDTIDGGKLFSENLY